MCGWALPTGCCDAKSAVAVVRERWKCIASVCIPPVYCSLPLAALVMKKQFFRVSAGFMKVRTFKKKFNE